MICKQRRMRRFSALVRGIVKTAANRNGRQFNDFGFSVWVVGIRPCKGTALMDTRHISAVAIRQGDPQITTGNMTV